MPKKQIFGSIIILVLLSFICMYIYDNYKVETTTSIVLKESSNCKKNLTEYYTDSKGNNYYLLCLDDIIIDYTDRTLELNKALEAKQTNLDFLLSNTEEKKIEKSIIEYKNDNYKIIECKLKNGKSNYIIGNSEINYFEGLCNETPYTCSFTKTYYIQNISNSIDGQFTYLTIRNDLKGEVETIKLSNIYNDLIEADNYYKFTFTSTDEQIEEDIKELFKNNNLININILEEGQIQKNDEECK